MEILLAEALSLARSLGLHTGYYYLTREGRRPPFIGPFKRFEHAAAARQHLLDAWARERRAAEIARLEPLALHGGAAGDAARKRLQALHAAQASPRRRRREGWARGFISNAAHELRRARR